MFERLTREATAPNSYAGLFCTAVQNYSANNPGERVFNIGSSKQECSELAAFFGNVLYESDKFRAGREYLQVGDPIEIEGGYIFVCSMG